MFKITFGTSSDAFFEDREAEIDRILRQIGSRVLDGVEEDFIKDVNGNTIGAWTKDTE